MISRRAIVAGGALALTASPRFSRAAGNSFLPQGLPEGVYDAATLEALPGKKPLSQVRAPHNIKDALGNLCMLFAGSLGDDDVKLFKYHARDEEWTGTIYELNYFTPKRVDGTKKAKDDHDKEVNFDWNWSNFDNGVERGYRSATELLNLYFCFQCYLGKDLGGDEDEEKAYDYAKELTN